MKDPSILPMQADGAKQAGEMLGRAFADDPVMTFWLPDPKQRHQRVPQLMLFAVRYCLLHGVVETTPEVDGVVCWLPPGEVDYHLGSLLRTRWPLIPLQSGLRNYARFFTNEEWIHRIRLRAVPDPHWYLWALGVEPSRQRQGIGGRLLAKGLERVDAQHLPCYLETHNPSNVPFYQRYGFEVFENSQVPGYELTVWGMVRRPRAD